MSTASSDAEITTDHTTAPSGRRRDRRRRAAAAATITVVGGSLVVSGSPAGAATFEVTNTDPMGAGSFAQAVIDANGAAGPDEITFADGLAGTIELTAVARIKDDLTITGPGDGSVELQSSAGEVLYLYNAASLSLSGLTFTGGQSAGSYGAILESNSAMTIGDVNIDNVVLDVGTSTAFELKQAQAVAVSNLSGNAGQVIQVEGATSFTLSDVDVELVAPFSSAVSASNVTGDVFVSDVALTSNLTVLSVGNVGGAVDLSQIDFDGDFVGVQVETVAGAVSVADIHSSGDMNVNIDTVAGPATVNNVSSDQPSSFAGFFGVGTSLENVADLTITDSVLSGSLMVDSSTVEITDTTIVGDTFGYPGLLITDMSDVVATQVTITDVEATLFGGVVVVADSSLALRHSTITESRSATSAINVDSGDLVLDHTTAVIDFADDGQFVELIDNGTPPTLAAEYSAVPTGAVADLALSATNLETDDAMLAPLADNGGPTLTHLPMPGSPLIDAGNPDIAAAPPLDQRDGTRINPGIDIGSTEYAALIKSVAPSRFADTRSGQTTVDGDFSGGGQRTAGSTYEVQVGGRGDIPANATAAVINITAINPSGVGFITAYSCDDEQPTASSLNYTPGSNLGNEVVAGLSADGKVCMYTSAATDMSIDVVGYITPESMLKSVTPARAMETRFGQPTADGQFDELGRLAAGSATTVRLAGRNGVPANASAVIVNVTAINPSSVGFVTMHPCLAELPTASSLNYTPGTNRGNEIVAELNAFGELCVFTSADTDLALDVVGYLPPGSYESVSPARILESRAGETTVDGASQATGRLTADSQVTVQVAGRADVPADATAAIVNVTAINPGARGFVTVHACVDPRPTASSLNFESGVSGGNEVIAGLDSAGAICLYTSGATDLAVDIVGFIR